MLAVVATKPLLLGPEPIAVPETVPPGSYGYIFESAPALTEPAWPGG